MNLKNLFVVQAIVALACGIGLLASPRTVMLLYGVAQEPGTVLMTRYFGVELLALGLLAALARNVSDSDAKRAILTAYVASDAIGLIVSLVGTLSGVMNAVGWTTVVIYLFFGLAFGYFLIAKPDTP
jgi:hypothetical protein